MLPNTLHTLDGVLDGHALLGHLCVHLKGLSVGAEQLDLRAVVVGWSEGAGSASGALPACLGPLMPPFQRLAHLALRHGCSGSRNQQQSRRGVCRKREGCPAKRPLHGFLARAGRPFRAQFCLGGLFNTSTQHRWMYGSLHGPVRCARTRWH